MSFRQEVKEFTRCCDVLLNGLKVPLTDEERDLMSRYVERLEEKMGLRMMQGQADHF
jgi:hypothetical protein